MRPEDLLKLEIVEGASKYIQKITEAPSSITIIGQDEIKKYGYRTLADILQSVRGLNVSYNREYSFLGIRGFNRGDFNSRMLLLVNGHRMNNSLSDDAFIGTEFILDVDLIERVEVIRGPGSSLYGNNAFFGVVNVITRKGRDLTGNGVEVSGEAGSFDTYKGRATYGHNFMSGVEMLFSGSWYDSEGPDNLTFKEFQSGVVHHVHEVDDDAYHSVFGSIGFKDLTLEGAYNDREKGIPTGTFGTKYGDARTRTTDDRGYVTLKFAHEFPDIVDLSAQIYYDRQDATIDRLLDITPETLERGKQHAEWWGMELRLKKTLFERIVVIGGAEYRDDFEQRSVFFDVSPPGSGTPRTGDTYNWGTYLQADTAILTNLHLNTGFRYDQYGHTESTVNPRFALIYDPWEKTTLKGIWGQAFRAPNFFERGVNPDLIPELITTGEVDWEQGIGRHVRSSVSAFYNQIDHLINFQGGTYHNVDGATAKGCEFELLGWCDPGFRGRLSYALQDTEFEEAGVLRSDSPKQLAKLNLIAPLMRDKLFAGLEFQYTSKRLTFQGTETSGFGVVNLTLFSQNLFKGLELSGSIYNLLDRHYDDPATPISSRTDDVIARDGRTFRVKLTYRF